MSMEPGRLQSCASRLVARARDLLKSNGFEPENRLERVGPSLIRRLAARHT